MRLVILALLVTSACSGNKAGDPKLREQAVLEIKRFVNEAYPAWALAHPEKACPDKLDELTEYATPSTRIDPWGNPYYLLCGKKLPGDARGIAIYSFGADGEDDTADDVLSWN